MNPMEQLTAPAEEVMNIQSIKGAGPNNTVGGVYPFGEPELESMPDIEPGDAIVDDHVNSMDAESEIYAPPSADYAKKVLQGRVQMDVWGATGTTEATTGDALEEVGMGIVSGAGDMLNSVSDLIDTVGTPVVTNIASKLTGKSPEQLAKESGFFQVQDRELPDWLKPETPIGDITNAGTQFGLMFTGLGEMAKIAEARLAISGVTNSVPLFQRIGQTANAIGEELPALTKLAKTGIDAIKLQGQDALANFLGFDRHEGNILDSISAVAGQYPGMGQEIARFVQPLTSDSDDGEIEARLKNTLVSKLGDAPGIALFNTARVLKAINKYKGVAGGELAKTGKAAKDLLDALRNVDEAAESAEATFKQTLDTDPEALLSQLFHSKQANPANVTPEAVQAKINEHNPNTVTLKGELSDDGSISIKAEQPEAPVGQEAAAPSPQMDEQGGRGGTARGNNGQGTNTDAQGVDSRVEVLPNETPLDEYAGRVFKAYEGVHAGRLAAQASAVRDVVQDAGRKARKGFDSTGFVNSVGEKLRRGQPVVIHEEIMKHLSNEGLTDINAFKLQFPKVIQSTVQEIKRYVSWDHQKQRVSEILGFELGHEEWLGEAQSDAFSRLIDRGTKDVGAIQEAVLNMTGLRMFSEQVLPQQILQKSALRATAKINKQATASLDAEIRSLNEHLTQARTEIKMIKSELGRGLNAGKIPVDGKFAKDFEAWYKKGQKGVPLLAQGSGHLTDAQLDAMALAAQDFHNMGGMDQVGRAEQAAKYFNMFCDAAAKAGSYGVGATRELFYNNVLSSFKTWKNIAWGTAALHAAEKLSDTTGALATGNKELLLQSIDESVAFTRYIGEGLTSALSVLRTGSKHALDYTPANPHVISADGLRQHFGKSVGDALDGTLFGGGGKFADWVIDKVGTVVNIPTTNIIGGIDTAFTVANQRALVYRELSALARYQGHKGINAKAFVEENMDKVTNDLIKGRYWGWNNPNFVPENQVVNAQALEALSNTLIDNTDTIKLSKPLHTSDRWLFRNGVRLDGMMRDMGLFGTAEMPFVKTFVNAAQWGLDSTPITALMSPYNHKILAGEIGSEKDRANLIGKLLLGGVVGFTGMGLAGAGMTSEIAGSNQAQKIQSQLTNENTYTVKIPTSTGQSMVVNLSKGSPITDSIFIPAKLWQIANSTRDGSMDPGSASYATITLGAEAFGSSRMLRGLSVTLDSLNNATYSTPDNIKRNLLDANLSILAVPRYGEIITAATDPYYRDFNSWQENAATRIPGLSSELSPNYDFMGYPRPSNDYYGDTNNIAMGATRLLTSVGVSYVNEDPVAKELDRFGKLGKTFTPPSKNMDYFGVPLPLDTFKNAKGESLWDKYNQLLRENKFPAKGGQELTLRESLNDIINSQEYKDGDDNRVTEVSGRRKVVIGSRWGLLLEMYQDAKSQISNTKDGDLWSYSDDYRNEKGQTVDDVVDEMEAIKDKIGSPE